MAASDLTAALESVTDEAAAAMLLPHVRALCELASGDGSALMAAQPAQLGGAEAMGLPPKRSRISLPPPGQQPSVLQASAALAADLDGIS